MNGRAAKDAVRPLRTQPETFGLRTGQEPAVGDPTWGAAEPT